MPGGRLTEMPLLEFVGAVDGLRFQRTGETEVLVGDESASFFPL